MTRNEALGGLLHEVRHLLRDPRYSIIDLSGLRAALAAYDTAPPPEWANRVPYPAPEWIALAEQGDDVLFDKVEQLPLEEQVTIMRRFTTWPASSKLIMNSMRFGRWITRNKALLGPPTTKSN